MSNEVERIFDLGDRVLAFVRYRGIGKGSGVPVDVGNAQLVTLRDGKVIRWAVFGDRAKALEAARLSE
jgi:ketosteroid isomerase-like protein